MKIRTIDRMKVPEGVRVPYLGGRAYAAATAIERRTIEKLPFEGLGLNHSPRAEKITVSLTTFPARSSCVVLAIKSLLNQTLRPDRIVLWIAPEQFKDGVPSGIWNLATLGVSIEHCEDLKSHKKYYHALRSQGRNELVVTYDDDLIYPEDSLELLYKAHVKWPGCIVCNRAARATVLPGGVLGPYSSWSVNSPEGVDAPSMGLFPSTGGGALYPYGAVNEEIFNVERMRELAPTADDLWVRFMSLLNGTRVVKTRRYHKPFSTLRDSQDESLQVHNCLEGENDHVIRRLSAAYPDALRGVMVHAQA